jgi:hypothetical protein
MASSNKSYPHIAWAIGHIIVFLATSYTLLSLVIVPYTTKSYYLAYSGAIVSWGIVVVS